MSRIYRVDDHPLVREGLRAVLQRHGHEVVGESETPEQALADLRSAQAELLLLDLHLGPHSGLDVLRQIKDAHIEVRVLMLSMASAPHMVAQAISLGASGFLRKGVSPGELISAVDAVMDGREVYSAGLRPPVGPPAPDALATLSSREREIVVMVVNGLSSAAIGVRLDLSPKTVDTYRSRLMAKLHVHDTPGLVRWAIRCGVIGMDEPGTSPQ